MRIKIKIPIEYRALKLNLRITDSKKKMIECKHVIRIIEKLDYFSSS